MTDEHVKGTVTDVKGKVEEAAGKVTGNEEQEAHGKAKQVQGEAQKGPGRRPGRRSRRQEVAPSTSDTRPPRSCGAGSRGVHLDPAPRLYRRFAAGATEGDDCGNR